MQNPLVLVLVIVIVLVIDKTHDPSNSLLLFSIDFSCRSMASFLDVFDYDYEQEHEHEHEHEGVPAPWI